MAKDTGRAVPGGLRTERALRIRKGPLACAPVPGAVCFARTCHGAGDNVHGA